MKRKAITPVVAVVLLLMMTVAAAGAFYVWTQGLIGGQTGKARQRLSTEMQIMDLSCDAANDGLDFFISNTGEASVDAAEVRVYVYNVSTGNLADTTTISRGDIAPGNTWDGTAAVPNANLLNGFDYRVQFEFVNQNSYTITETCQAS
ncbi:MAG: archaellin/type IV pilin N-terminal domain-containing protein [Candidatus Nanohaloarchaea archaeon]|nr:archaellin/type IV pilin N-terminal domain-containing protein [Candidatus Nanohaloarchaea archaeon]